LAILNVYDPKIVIRKILRESPEGAVDVVLTNTKCFDNAGASGSNSYTSLFTSEDDPIVASAINFKCILYYEGTSIPPEDKSGITVKVELGGVLKGSTTAINANGSF